MPLQPKDTESLLLGDFEAVHAGTIYLPSPSSPSACLRLFAVLSEAFLSIAEMTPLDTTPCHPVAMGCAICNTRSAWRPSRPRRRILSRLASVFKRFGRGAVTSMVNQEQFRVPEHTFRSLCYLDHPAPMTNRKFDRFMDLPPELRERVYEFYMEDNALDEIRYNIPKEAPITHVSRLIRCESLPFFYAVTRFPLRFHCERQWYQRKHPARIARIRRLQIDLERGVACAVMHPRTFLLDIQIVGGKVTLRHREVAKQWDLPRLLPQGYLLDQRRQAVQREAILVANMKEVSESIKFRPHGFDACDLGRIHCAFFCRPMSEGAEWMRCFF